MSALNLTEAVEAAARAAWESCPMYVTGDLDEWDTVPTMVHVNMAEMVLPIVEAAAVVLEQQLRTLIAAEIEVARDAHFAEYGDEMSGPRGFDRGMSAATRIARGPVTP